MVTSTTQLGTLVRLLTGTCYVVFPSFIPRGIIPMPWQLRGMATTATHQRQGIGQLLLMFAIDEASQEKPSWPFWCNARTTAIGFYEQAGWSTATDVFDIPTAGPHVKMHFVAP
jgi:GNAT superfamily N-acetyltransferase